ncbi:hypothetical protein B1B05_10070 [Domibacillus enclensis]|uniref:Uncharacterized protein n=1 Tax=Domibacillus enclensis TaxID=1017273 RepID=A0ABX4E8E8_9BACI|nr:hypothetical protein B1B05_10070 [Domibacillus enclensis]
MELFPLFKDTIIFISAVLAILTSLISIYKFIESLFKNEKVSRFKKKLLCKINIIFKCEPFSSYQLSRNTIAPTLNYRVI